MKRFTLAALTLSTLAFAACQTSPTGRKQLAFVSDKQMDEMGQQAFTEMKSKQPIGTDRSQTEYVNCVARAIVAVLPEKREWEIVVFKDDSANAFALPGGKIGVHTGLLKVARTPSQLAAVLGHEVGHVLAAHSKERVSEQMVTQGGMKVLSTVLGNPNDTRHSLLMGALGLGAQYGVALPHGRRQESEADIIGLDLMAKAGFDPRESIQLWKNMAEAGGGGPPEFLSTHPSHSTRIKGLNDGMPEALATYNQAKQHPACKI
ncbi:MAG: M48 family peptidase [Proteobacteria bacterium]|nr:MAG: M48 family peptidase [Pseudomonadota bacterium]